jgi:PIH1 N-terminal domain
MNVPLSVGPQYRENDHAGKSCIVYDIIVNPKVLLDATSDLTGQYRDFLCHLCIQSVEQKYPTHGILDRQYKLPKLQYMGSTVRSQYVRDKRSIPKIQEVSETVVPNLGVKKSSSSGPKTEYIEAEKEIHFRLCWIRRKSTKFIDDLGNENTATKSEYETPISSSSESNWKEYIEPIAVPDEDVLRVSLFVSLSGTVSERDVDAKVSPFKFQVSTEHMLCFLHSPLLRGNLKCS